MKTKRTTLPPFLLFWIGVLTGAVIVALVFLYKMYSPEIQANVLRATKITSPITTTTTNLLNSTNLLTPVAYPDPKPW